MARRTIESGDNSQEPHSRERNPLWQEAGRQLKILRQQSPFPALSHFARMNEIDKSYLHGAENGKHHITRRLIDIYIDKSGMEINDKAKLRNYILLLTGAAPADLTLEKVRLVVEFLEEQRKKEV